VGSTDLLRVGLLAAVGAAFWLLSESTWVEPAFVPIRSATATPGEVPGVPTKGNASDAGGARDTEQVSAAPAQRPEPAARPAPTVRSAPTRIRVVVKLRGDAHGVDLPEPELLRLDEHGQPWPVAAQGRKANRRHPAVVRASRDALASRNAQNQQARQTSRTFEVTKPGRYVAAWHLWMNAEGTRTWRVCRGRGPEILLSGGERVRELVVYVGAAELQLDPVLDMRATNAHTTVTAKDG